MTIHSVYDVHLQFSSVARDILYCILHLIFALLVTSKPTAHNDHITKHSHRLYAGRQYLTKSNTVKKNSKQKITPRSYGDQGSQLDPANHFSFSPVNFWPRSALRFKALASCLSFVSAEGSNLLRRIRVTADVLMPNPVASLGTVHVSGCSLCNVFRCSIWSRDSLFIGLHVSWPYLASFLRCFQSSRDLYRWQSKSLGFGSRAHTFTCLPLQWCTVFFVWSPWMSVVNQTGPASNKSYTCILEPSD